MVPPAAAPTAAAGHVDSLLLLHQVANGMPEYPRTNVFLSQSTHNPHKILIKFSSGLIF
jgi:hypothetical protein